MFISIVQQNYKLTYTQQEEKEDKEKKMIIIILAWNNIATQE